MTNWGALLLEDGTTLLDSLKLYLGIDPVDTTRDDVLNRALDLSGSMCESYIDRVIAKRLVTEFFQSYFGRVVLHNHPIDLNETVEVFLDGVKQSDYKVFRERWGVPHLTRQSQQQDMPLDWRAYDQVTVSYTAGYDPLPADLAQALVYVASDLQSSEGTGNPPGGGGSGAVKSMSIQDVGSITYDVGSSGGSGGSVSSFGVMNDSATAILSRYKRMSA